MIAVNLHQSNTFFEIVSGKSEEWRKTYESYTEEFDMSKLECNCCHCRGECIRHGYYERNYLIGSEDLVSGSRIRILRVKCKNCGHTHAVLPAEIVPYTQYSIVFIYAVLLMYYVKKETVEKICEVMYITVPQLYRWKKRFLKQKERYLGVLSSMQMDGPEAMIRIGRLTDYGMDLAVKYLKLAEKMPMQKHRNATNMRRPVFS